MAEAAEFENYADQDEVKRRITAEVTRKVTNELNRKFNADLSKARQEERDRSISEAKAHYDLSHARWTRFWLSGAGLLGASMVVLAIFGISGCISEANTANDQTREWISACVLDGGQVYQDASFIRGSEDSSKPPRLCVMGGKVVRTHD